MLETKVIRKRFDSLKEFEDFSLKLIRICAKLNKTGRNAELLSMAETRAEHLEGVWE